MEGRRRWAAEDTLLKLRVSPREVRGSAVTAGGGHARRHRRAAPRVIVSLDHHLHAHRSKGRPEDTQVSEVGGLCEAPTAAASAARLARGGARLGCDGGGRSRAAAQQCGAASDQLPQPPPACAPPGGRSWAARRGRGAAMRQQQEAEMSAALDPGGTRRVRLLAARRLTGERELGD